MKTRTTRPENTSATDAGPGEEEQVGSSQATYNEGPSPEVWIFDGMDKDAVPYEINLPHPRSGELCMFALAPKKGVAVIGEIRVFKPSTPASFITALDEESGNDALSQSSANGHGDGGRDHGDDDDDNNNNKEFDIIVSKPELKVATDIDPVFLLLPILVPSKALMSKGNSERGVFVSFDDLMDAWKEKSEHVSFIVDDDGGGGRYVFGSHPEVSLSMVPALKSALERCCDTAMAGDETMYRYSEEKFFDLVLKKARRVVEAGLPPSMEELALRSVETTGFSASKPIDLDADSMDTSGPGDLEDSQKSNASSVFSRGEGGVANDAAAAPPAATEEVPPNLALMRLRLAVGLILSNYVPPVLSKKVQSRLDNVAAAGVDFEPLRQHIDDTKKQRAAIAAARSTTSMKHDLENDTVIAEREEKRRKKEEEEKKRKSESLGIKALRKVDTSGMKKMSSFFAARPKNK